MSNAIAAVIAHAVFWALTAIGVASGELGPRSTAVILALWLAGFFGLDYVARGAVPFASYVAVIDVALVLLIFKSDVDVT